MAVTLTSAGLPQNTVDALKLPALQPTMTRGGALVPAPTYQNTRLAAMRVPTVDATTQAAPVAPSTANVPSVIPNLPVVNTSDAGPATSAPVTGTAESGIIPATNFAPVENTAVAKLPAFNAVTANVTGNNTNRPVVINPTDPTFVAQSNKASPFTDQFGNVRQGSFDDLFNTKLLSTRAANQNKSNVQAFEAGTSQANAATSAKRANDEPVVAANKTIGELAANAASNAVSRENNAATVGASRENNTADIASRERVAQLSSEALSKQFRIQPISEETSPSGVVTRTYGTLDNQGNITPIKLPSIGTNVPPPGYIAALKQNPDATHVAAFNRRYGDGAADKYLGR